MATSYDWPYYSPSETTDDYPYYDGNYYTAPKDNPFDDNYYTAPERRPQYHYQPANPYSWTYGNNYHTTPCRPPYQPPMRKSTAPTISAPKSTDVRSHQPKEVASIPVIFIGSGDKQPSRSDYAVKIQKAFRGFRVRNNVKKILELNREVDDVGRSLLEGETVELIKRVDRERLKVAETLMALLFKLDSIRGVNDAVRVCRKAVIRKAIMLQEKVDSFANAVDEKETLEIGEDCCETLEIGEEGSETLEIGCELGGNLDDSSTMQVEVNEEEAVVEDELEIEKSDDESAEEEIDKFTDCCDNAVEIDENAFAETGVEMQVESDLQKIEADDWECVGVENENVEFVDIGEGAAEKPTEDENSSKNKSNDEWLVVEESRERKKLLEKIVEDNAVQSKNLLEMVVELRAENAAQRKMIGAQSKMIGSLAHRVEQLEKYMNDRLRKKEEKKKRRY